QPGDTDLSWTGATAWRSVLAATLDQPAGEITGGAVGAEAGNPTADLIAAWLSLRLGVPVATEPTGGPGITEVRFTSAEGDIAICRPDGRVAHLSRPGQPERRVALHRRDTTELLEEELRRLDPDDVYADVLAPFRHAPGPVPGPRQAARDEPARGHRPPRCWPACQGGRRAAGHQAGGHPGRCGQPVAGAHRGRDRHGGTGRAGGRPGPRRRRLAPPGHLVGGPGGSCPGAAPEPTRAA